MVNTDILLTLLRVVVGLLMFGHGAQKLLGWFGGKGMSSTADMTGHLGFRPAKFWAWILALAEFIGGLALTFGFFTPIAAAVLIGDMIVAIAKVHGPNGLWDTNRGFEYNLVLIVALLVVGLTDPGIYSLDYVLRFTWPVVWVFEVSGIVVLAGVIVGLLTTIPEAIHGQQTHTH